MSRIALVAVIAVVAAVVAYVPSRRDRAGIRTLPARSTAALGAPSAGRDPAPVAEAPLADPPEADGPFADVYRFWRDLGFEEVVSKPFVLFNPGCGAWLYDGQLLYPLEYGWAMQTSSGAIVLRSATLKPTYYRLSECIPDKWEERKSLHPRGLPLPGEWHDVDFERYCRNLVDNDELHYRTSRPSMFGYSAAGPTWPTLIAYGALHRGYQLAATLMDQARALKGDKHATLLAAVEDEIAKDARYAFIMKGRQGDPLDAVRGEWQTLAERLPDHPLGKEAGELALLYSQLLGDPVPEDEDSVDHWIYQLRQVDFRQMSDPGMCVVTGSDAAQQLIHRHFAAIPALIEHIDDRDEHGEDAAERHRRREDLVPLRSELPREQDVEKEREREAPFSEHRPDVGEIQTGEELLHAIYRARLRGTARSRERPTTKLVAMPGRRPQLHSTKGEPS